MRRGRLSGGLWIVIERKRVGGSVTIWDVIATCLL